MTLLIFMDELIFFIRILKSQITHHERLIDVFLSVVVVSSSRFFHTKSKPNKILYYALFLNIKETALMLVLTFTSFV